MRAHLISEFLCFLEPSLKLPSSVHLCLSSHQLSGFLRFHVSFIYFTMLIVLSYYFPLCSWSYVVFIHVSGWFICVCYWIVFQGDFYHVSTVLTRKNAFWVSFSSRIPVEQRVVIWQDSAITKTDIMYMLQVKIKFR